jgi:hypothetical protein
VKIRGRIKGKFLDVMTPDGKKNAMNMDAVQPEKSQ